MDRLTQEFNNLCQSPEPHIIVWLANNSYYHWGGILNGPEGSPYEGGRFEFEIGFPSEFPSRPPEFIFKTPIFHPNVRMDGHVCCKIFADAWRPGFTVRSMILYVGVLLNDPISSADTGYLGEARDLCFNDREGFCRRARDETKRYAM